MVTGGMAIAQRQMIELIRHQTQENSVGEYSSYYFSDIWSLILDNYMVSQRLPIDFRQWN